MQTTRRVNDGRTSPLHVLTNCGEKRARNQISPQTEAHKMLASVARDLHLHTETHQKRRRTMGKGESMGTCGRSLALSVRIPSNIKEQGLKRRFLMCRGTKSPVRNLPCGNLSPLLGYPDARKTPKCTARGQQTKLQADDTMCAALCLFNLRNTEQLRNIRTITNEAGGVSQPFSWPGQPLHMNMSMR